jgi:hypothetical protein
VPGFKSVFQVSDRPAVFSRNFRFEFRALDSSGFGFLLPHWIPASEVPVFVQKQMREWTTVINLPTKDSLRGKHQQKWKNLALQIGSAEPPTVLFLRQVSCLTISNHMAHSSITLQRKVSKITPALVQVSASTNDSSGCNTSIFTYWLHRENLHVPVGLHRSQVEQTEMVLAFPLLEDGSAQSSVPQPVCAFLPLRSYGFRFIIQADFTLPSSREDLQFFDGFNIWLRQRLPQAFLRAVETMKRKSSHHKLMSSWYKFVPMESELSEFFAPVAKQMLQLLARTKCVLTEHGSWIEPVKAVNLTLSVLESMPKGLRFLLQKSLVHHSLSDEVAPLLKLLGVTNFSLSSLLELCSSAAGKAVLESGSAAESRALLLLIGGMKSNDAVILKELSRLPLFHLEGHIEPSPLNIEPIFFQQRNQNCLALSFASELKVISPIYLESPESEPDAVKGTTAQRESYVIESALVQLGVEPLSAINLIHRFVVPSLRQDLSNPLVPVDQSKIDFLLQNLSIVSSEAMEIVTSMLPAIITASARNSATTLSAGMLRKFLAAGDCSLELCANLLRQIATSAPGRKFVFYCRVPDNISSLIRPRRTFESDLYFGAHRNKSQGRI